MFGVLLALMSAVAWGSGDFMGGMQSKRLPAFTVVLWSQFAGACLLMVVVAITRPHPVVGSLLWGGAGGVVGAGALVLFYRGLASGVMSIVAPVSACGVIIPVLASLALGHVPGPIPSIGIVAAILGIVLVSIHTEHEESEKGNARTALLLALGAACGFGLFFVGIEQGTAIHDGSALWATVGARGGSLLFLPSLVLFRRASAPWPGRRMPTVALVGCLDSTANLLFAIATTRGNLAVVAVLGSLYPVATVLLGQIILRERLTRLQGSGVGLALLGVALVSVG